MKIMKKPTKKRVVSKPVETKTDMLYVMSRYNHDVSWVKDYTNNVVMYDRSEEPLEGSIVVPNKGSDIADKFKYIIDNYDNLPEVAVYTKANIFKYITKEEFDLIKDNKTFTPILTAHHRTYTDSGGVVCFYKDGIYHERNDYWYLRSHPTKTVQSANELREILGFNGKDFLAFAPGSSYIVPRENILRHPKELYEKLRNYMIWAVYPGECQLMERGLYNLWK